VDALPPRLILAARLLFVLSGVLIGTGLVCLIGGTIGAEALADLLLARILAEIDPDTLAALPAGFLTPATVQRAALALGIGLLGFGAAQLITAIGLRRGWRWSYAAAVIGGLFVAFAAGASAVFMLAATARQPQAAALLVVGAVVVGLVAVAYAAIAVLTAAGRRELEASTA
jgi:MFS family permease